MKHLFSFLLFFLIATASAAKLDWNPAEQLHQGIRLLRIERTEPRLMKIFIMRIDLQTPGLAFHTTGRDPDWGKAMPDYPEKFLIRTKRRRTVDFMKEARKSGTPMVAAFNASPWSPWTRPFNHAYADLAGLCISNGEIVSDRRPQRAQFTVYKDGHIAITREIPESEYGKIQLSVSGFFIILENGKIQDSTQRNRSLAPRMAYGLSADGKYLYLLAIDGRQKKRSMGATVGECAEILRDAGADDALNMDGGGSTTLCYWDEKADRPTVINRHSSPGYTRTVGNSVGVSIQK